MTAFRKPKHRTGGTYQTVGEHVVALSSRVRAIRWSEKSLFRRSQGRLLQEYLRRSALWRLELGRGGWPFYDIALTVNPGVRAPQNVVDRTLASLSGHGTFYAAHTVEWALHFAALKDSEQELPDLADPFFPLLLVYERGDSVNPDYAGSIEVGGIHVPRGVPERYARTAPLTDFSEGSLNAMDQRERNRRQRGGGDGVGAHEGET
ncbi:hypothetical protein [Nocardiopsis synnemataformans]|uniref:hypothetical protein n=1 Tax=Nocardiopsis synnemataformans TaxID=61305 RepID=UPI003EBD7612